MDSIKLKTTTSLQINSNNSQYSSRRGNRQSHPSRGNYRGGSHISNQGNHGKNFDNNGGNNKYQNSGTEGQNSQRGHCQNPHRGRGLNSQRGHGGGNYRGASHASSQCSQGNKNFNNHIGDKKPQIYNQRGHSHTSHRGHFSRGSMRGGGHNNHGGSNNSRQSSGSNSICMNLVSSQSSNCGSSQQMRFEVVINTTNNNNDKNIDLKNKPVQNKQKPN